MTGRLAGASISHAACDRVLASAGNQIQGQLRQSRVSALHSSTSQIGAAQQGTPSVTACGPNSLTRTAAALDRMDGEAFVTRAISLVIAGSLTDGQSLLKSSDARMNVPVS